MFRLTAAGPSIRSRFCLILAISVTVVTSGCGLLTPANYIAKPHMQVQESRTPFCYRHASRLVTRCDRVEYRSDEDVRALLNSRHIPSFRALGAVN
jgi:hypothetical protein